MIDVRAAKPEGETPRCYSCDLFMVWRLGEYLCPICGMRPTTVSAGFTAAAAARDDPQFRGRLAPGTSALRAPLPPPSEPRVVREVTSRGEPVKPRLQFRAPLRGASQRRDHLTPVTTVPTPREPSRQGTGGGGPYLRCPEVDEHGHRCRRGVGHASRLPTCVWWAAIGGARCEWTPGADRPSGTRSGWCPATVELDGEQAAWMRERAARLGLSLRAVLREAVDLFIATRTD